MLLSEIHIGQTCKITHNYPDKQLVGMIVSVYDIAEPGGLATSPQTGMHYQYSRTKSALLVTGEGLYYSNAEIGWCFIEPQYLQAVINEGLLIKLQKHLCRAAKSLFAPWCYEGSRHTPTRHKIRNTYFTQAVNIA